jgi:hypothetical protein
VRAVELLILANTLVLVCLFVDIVEAIHPFQSRLECIGPYTELSLTVNIEQAAIHAQITKDLDDLIEVLVEIHRTSESNVSKVTLALLICVFAGRTDLAGLDHSEARIKDSTGNRSGSLKGLICCNLNYRSLGDLLGRGDAKLNSDNGIGHLLLYLCLDYCVYPFCTQISELMYKICQRLVVAAVAVLHHPTVQLTRILVIITGRMNRMEAAVKVLGISTA